MSDLVATLRQALDLRAVARPVDSAAYRFSMDNDFVSPTGHVLRRQRFTATYTRSLIGALSTQAALFRFAWTAVEFASTSSDPSRSAASDPIRWTFAEGRTFEYYRPFPTALAGEVDRSEGDFVVGDWYADLARLPAVNLMVMATWDVLTFEAMAGVLACDGLGEYGVPRPISTMDNAHVHLDFQGFSAEESTFENGAVLGRPVGVTLIGATPCAGVAFQGSGRLHVGGGDTDRSQQGESYYLGSCHLSLDDADLATAEMTESLTVSMTNKSGRQVPMHKRRVVRITREDLCA